MQRTRSCGGCPARSRRVASPTTWRAKCPAPPRSRPPGLPSALSSMSEMKSTLVTAPLAQIETPLLAIALAQGSTLPKSLGELDRAAGGGGVLARAVASGDFKGKRDESLLVYRGGGKAQRILLFGLGKGAEVTRSAIRRAAAVGAKRVAEAYGFGLTVLDRAALQREAMGALLAVAQGTAEEPRFIVLEYRGGGEAPPVALVGKGVTFDAGGISIKPAQNMEDMKFDMSGAAAVLGTFEALGRLKPKLNVTGLIPSTENLPSGTAVKPGDVVKSHLGKTIEIINTDAEGRLILCDALSYVRRFKPAAVLDAATLTGAVVVALGHVAIGVMGNDEGLLAEVRDAGARAGERCWPLPLWEEYRELLKSDMADVKNSGGRGAGTIAGGWFLREFVDGFPWVHLDIAGTAYTEGEVPHQAKGPTGIGVRLFSEFILKRAGA